MIEHIGLCVENPYDMADWYVKNLGFHILKKGGNNDDGVVFIEDSKNNTVLELYNLPGLTRMPFSSFEPPAVSYCHRE